MTSSARASSDGGIVSPRALAVLRLMTNSNLVGCSTGSIAVSRSLQAAGAEEPCPAAKGGTGEPSGRSTGIRRLPPSGTPWTSPERVHRRRRDESGIPHAMPPNLGRGNARSDQPRRGQYLATLRAEPSKPTDGRGQLGWSSFGLTARPLPTPFVGVFWVQPT
jgi:hypothetical protein